MIKSIHWATYAACCGLIAILVQGGNLTLADTPLPYAHPLPCGGGCICIPNAKHYGYFRTIWRQWPSERRPEIAFPQSVGVEIIPTPPGEEPLPLPEALPETILIPEEGILPPGEGFQIDQGTPEVPAEPEATPPAETPLPGTLPGLPQEPGKIEGGTELPGTLPGLPVSPDSIPPAPSDDDNPFKEKPAEEPAEKPLDNPFENESSDNPFQTGPGGRFQPYFMPQPPVPVPQEPTLPPEELVEEPTAPPQEVAKALRPEEVPKALSPQEVAEMRARAASEPPQKLVELEPSARPLHKVAEGEPERHERLQSPASPALLSEGSDSEPAPPARLSQDLSPAAKPLRALAKELIASALPLQARANAPQSLAPPGEAIVEPTLPAAPQPLNAEPPGHAELEPANRPEVELPGLAEIEPARPPVRESARANWAAALNSSFRTGGDQTTFSSNDFVPALDGYCPVALIEKERWMAGNSALLAVHHGRTYFFSNSAARQRFLAAPDRHAPAYRGNDPVLLVDEGRRVPGQTDYCITCNGRLYAFSCEETLRQFQKEPQKYAAPAEK